MATGGGGLGFELALAALGTLLGVAAGMIFRVFRGADEIPRSQAGIGYAALWIVVVGARIGFSYATSNSHRLQVWLFTHHIIADAITVAPIFRAAGMLVLRAAVLHLRARPHGAVPGTRHTGQQAAGPRWPHRTVDLHTRWSAMRTRYLWRPRPVNGDLRFTAVAVRPGLLSGEPGRGPCRG